MSFRYLVLISRQLLVPAALALALAAAPAHAQVWNEIGDAGALVATAQATAGVGGFTTIHGNLASAGDVDMYCIHLGSVPPAGTLLAGLGCVAIQAPDIWLFNASGKGVLAATTCQFGYKAIIAPAVSLAPGDYYVAVSNYGVDPYAGANAIWLPSSSASHAPDGPGAAGTLTQWLGTGIPAPINPYQIDMNLMFFCSSPTPAAHATWGSLKIRYGI